MKGVSTLIGTITLLSLTLMIFAVYLGAVVREGKAPASPIYPMVKVESEGGKLVIKHMGGDEIPKAFKLSNGAVTWLAMVVRFNGENLNVTSGARMGNLTTGMVDFGPGSKLELPLSVGSGSRVTVVYVPTGQILCEEKF